MKKKHGIWIWAALGPALLLGLLLPRCLRAAGSAPIPPADDTVRRQAEALVAQEENLLNLLLAEESIDRAAQQGCARVIDYGAGQLLPVGGCAEPVLVKRIVLLFSDDAPYAAVYTDTRQAVFALDGALLQQLRGAA